MATEIKMPQLGESVTEGTISNWLVSPGDRVNKYEPLAEVVTDKVNAEIPSTFTGTIKDIMVQVDETVAVGTVICSIIPDEESASSDQQEESSTERNTQDESTNTSAQGSDQSQKKRYSPAVIRLAGEHQIDLALVDGTGRGGRITRKDIEAVIESGKHQTKAPQPAVKREATSQPATIEKTTSKVNSYQAGDREEVLAVSPVRKAIANNMVKSKHEAPHAWLTIEVDVTNLVEYRNRIKNHFKEKEGFSITYLPFFMKATVEALKEFPQLNSMWAGDKIIRKKDINLSMAVATEDSLFVPVIKNADDKTIKGLAKEVVELSSKVRSGTLTSQDSQGGTFTINNTGAFGSIMSAPIINHPQAAILSVESIVKRPVVMETKQGDMIAIRHMVNLCLSLDHRVLDGLVCGKFLAAIKSKLENMDESNLSVY
ncbi:dihydrolipoamide acetyltransferase family protein [Alkalihalobacillus pseudalcaliphilus]|uniref:dihydrolipoamide acetyltransferase family protein n=1 Tax=Alkalihalobacillus pseudalcaliphilus TaxID=79884 RepID=UPI00064DECFA|nr:dihydrolipoamide acetyltransferase family protein [Alkalihalobacillus pseudalcaliphilus]KMK77013.1 branched-chain alpha-keto acid dehydrogenase subunit E2 [Alkalihalobacillus pseudalcaliphilus]